LLTGLFSHFASLDLHIPWKRTFATHNLCRKFKLCRQNYIKLHKTIFRKQFLKKKKRYIIIHSDQRLLLYLGFRHYNIHAFNLHNEQLKIQRIQKYHQYHSSGYLVSARQSVSPFFLPWLQVPYCFLTLLFWGMVVVGCSSSHVSMTQTSFYLF